MEVSILMFTLIILTILIAIGAVAGLGYLYLRSFPRLDEANFEFFDRFRVEFLDSRKDPQIQALLISRYYDMKSEVIPDAFAKRQLFWSSFVQFSLSVIVVVLIAVLLLLRIVSAEAGLPILAAFGGAAVSQGVGSGAGSARSRSTPPIIGPREGPDR